MMPKIRPEIAAMSGYAPGEQPADIEQWLKLNTNENPYPPSPKCAEVLKTLDAARLRLYPNPTADGLRAAIAKRFGVGMENVIAGNGSDDILNLAVRVFVGAGEELVMVTPSYSLYPVLAEIQGAGCRQVALNPDFTLPDNLAEQLGNCKLVMIPSPNAPTGLPFPLTALRAVCKAFDGAVLIDEAYADFADENAVALLKDCPNVIISRTMSKSYALAGLRVGFALASEALIAEMMKVKDSYNVGLLPQLIATAAIEDEVYLAKTVALIRAERAELAQFLAGIGFTVIPSASNFIFAAPPDRNGLRCYEALKAEKILVRYFKGTITGEYVRITIGTAEEMKRLSAALTKIYAG